MNIFSTFLVKSDKNRSALASLAFARCGLIRDGWSSVCGGRLGASSSRTQSTWCHNSTLVANVIRFRLQQWAEWEGMDCDNGKAKLYMVRQYEQYGGCRGDVGNEMDLAFRNQI